MEHAEHGDPQPQDSVTARLDRIGKFPEEDREREIQSFVRERLAVLLPSAVRATFGVGDSNALRGFLHPEALNRVHGIHKLLGFHVDDDNAYVDGVREAVKCRSLAHAVQRAVEGYFGILSHNEKARVLRPRAEFYVSHASRGITPSIREMRGANMALCVERAAFAQNLITILGNESILMWMSARHRGEWGGHALNIVRSRDGRQIVFDSNNPFETYDEAGRLLDTAPALYQLTDRGFQMLMDGDSLLVVRIEKIRHSDGTETETRHPFEFNAR